MGGGEASKQGEAVDSGRPSSPKPLARAEKEEEELTEIEAIKKKEQQVSCFVRVLWVRIYVLALHLCIHS